MAFVATVITLFVTVLLFIAHRILEWKFERERFLRDKIENLSDLLHQLTELASAPSPSESNVEVLTRRDLRLLCADKVSRLQSHQRRIQMLISLYFPELKRSYAPLGKASMEFTKVLLDWSEGETAFVPESELNRGVLDSIRRVGQHTERFHDKIISNHNELTGNILGR